jgi:lysophospholipase L1-like esterase
MSEPDRSWTIGPALVWFGVTLCIALWLFDGGFEAVADRFNQRGEPGAPLSTSPFTSRPAVVADSDGDNAEDRITQPATMMAAKAGALDDTCVEGSRDACRKWAMDGFYRAIDAEKAGKLGRAVRVSWYGDSVIATDAIPGRLRARLQAELGDGGPGFVFVVPPHRFCGHEAISRLVSSDWEPHAISTVQIPDNLYGVGGSTALTHDGRATIKLVAGTASRVELYYLLQPQGGIAIVKADGAELLRVDTKGDKQAGYAAATTLSGREFKIATEGRVRLFGIDLENGSGAVVDNLGIVSVNVKSLANNDPAHFATELGHRQPDLVMVMIGANEAQWLNPGDRDMREYQARYEKVLAPIRKGRPDASCLVVSPTDQAEAKDGEYSSRPVMPVLIDAQRKAARAQGCAFYSTYEWMGGRGSATKWFRNGLVGSDFQHLSRNGANKLADAVFEALMAGYHHHAGR